MIHQHADAPAGVVSVGTVLLVAALLAAAVGYAVAAARRPWPRARTARWLLGVAAGITGAVLGGAAAHDLRAHAAGHLLLGMVAPLLLVTAAPVTLVLRALPRRRARTVASLLRSRPVGVLTRPAVAAVLDLGGMWLMLRTDLLADVPPSLVGLHLLLAGYLFAFSLVGADPAPHRSSLGARATVLVAAVAAHDVLAKALYAAPPVGHPVAEAEVAAVLLHYGGTPVHVALLVLLGREWAARQDRARRRRAVVGGAPR